MCGTLRDRQTHVRQDGTAFEGLKDVFELEHAGGVVSDEAAGW